MQRSPSPPLPLVLCKTKFKGRYCTHVVTLVVMLVVTPVVMLVVTLVL